MNTFVQYLDQFNVLSPNHAKIYDEYTNSSDKYRFSIQTRIEEFLLSVFRDSPRSVIMTGNAGDGKTRLCRAVYEKLRGQPLNGWPETGFVEVPFVHGKLIIVKDLSELTEGVIYDILSRLQHVIAEHHGERTYFLIAANEGKLTKFLSQNPSLQTLSGLVQARFMDHGNNDEQLYLVNLQDVTSSIYAARIMEEWNKEDNWADCGSCGKTAQCVIYLNHRRMSDNRIRERLVEQYRLLDCLGIHVTMREILIHISYTLTGGLTCQKVQQADYQSIESHARKVYYNNFYGSEHPEGGALEQGAVQHFRKLDPGTLSLSSIDDYLLNGDLDGDERTMLSHASLFDEEIDLLFGFYRKQIEMYRSHGMEHGSAAIVDRMPGFRRKYFFEADDSEALNRRRLVPYQHFYTFLEALDSRQKQAAIRKDMMTGLNHAFSKKLMDRSETQLFAVNENLFIFEAYSSGQVALAAGEGRHDIDYTPSKLSIKVNGVALEVKLAVFEYVLRLAGGGLNSTYKQEVDILLGTFRNDMISRSEADEYLLRVFVIDPDKGVYKRCEIDF